MKGYPVSMCDDPAFQDLLAGWHPQMPPLSATMINASVSNISITLS